LLINSDGKTSATVVFCECLLDDVLLMINLWCYAVLDFAMRIKFIACFVFSNHDKYYGEFIPMIEHFVYV